MWSLCFDTGAPIPTSLCRASLFLGGFPIRAHPFLVCRDRSALTSSSLLFQDFQAALEAGLGKPGSLPQFPTPGWRYRPLLPPFWGDAGLRGQLLLCSERRGSGFLSLWAEGAGNRWIFRVVEAAQDGILGWGAGTWVGGGGWSHKVWEFRLVPFPMGFIHLLFHEFYKLALP